jgi:hypothetical protein
MTVQFSGPLFDGGLDARMDRAISDAVDEAGEAAKRAVQRADVKRSGYTSSRVTVVRSGPTGFRVTGGGLVWRPWLEGTAPRNRISSYKGGRPFQRAAPTAGEAATEIVTDAVMGVLR